MRKKFIGVYALMAVLALGTTVTSCVDDNESASVTAIRDAKAKQLEALANLSNAQAEAEKITAEAEAALNNAKAAIEQAKAEYLQYKADSVAAVMDINIEAAKAKAEANLNQQKALLAESQAQLLAALDAVDEVTKQKIQTLLNNAKALMEGGPYMTYKQDATTGKWSWISESILADESILGLQQKKITLKSDIVKAETGLSDVKAEIAEYINEQDAEIAKQNTLLANYKELKENSGRAEIEKKYNDAQTNLVSYQKDETAKSELEKLANLDITNNVTDVMKKLPFVLALNDVNNNINYIDPNNGGSVYIYPEKYYTFETPDSRKIDFEYGDKTSGQYTVYYFNHMWVLTSSFGCQASYTASFDETTYATDYNNVSRDLKIQETLIAEAQKAYDQIVKDNETTLKNAQDAVKKAEEAFAKEATEANKQALEAAERALQQVEGTIESYRSAVEDAEDNKETIEEALAVLDAIKKLQEGEGSALSVYNEKVKEFVALVDAHADTYVEWMKADHLVTTTQNLINVLNPYINEWTTTDQGGNEVTVAPSIPDWDALIEECEDAIAEAEDNKATATAKFNIDGTTGDEEVTEELMTWYIEKLNDDLARVDAKLTLLNKYYDNCMSQANDLIENGATVPEIPETPAEGEGTETPAE